MAEENGTGTNTPVETQASPVPNGLADALSGLASSETIAKIAEIENKKVAPVAQQQDEPPAPAEPDGDAKGEEGQAVVDKQVTEKKTEEGVEDKKPATEKKSVFGFDKNKKKSDIVIETPEHILEVVKTKFGQELKDIKEFPKFLSSAEKWRADAQKAEALEKSNNDLTAIIENLPEDIMNSIQMYYKKEDYMKAFDGKPKFDYNTPVDKQDKKALVDHYFPGKFSEEDFKGDPSPALEIALTASEDKFKIEKKEIDGKRAAEIENASKKLESFKSSVSSSVNYLKQSFPDMAESDIEDVRTVLDGGISGITNFFLNQDGTLKQEAAEMLMMAKHGKSEMQRLMEAASNITETKMNEELLSRGADVPRQRKGQAAEALSNGAKSLIAEMNRLKESKTF